MNTETNDIAYIIEKKNFLLKHSARWKKRHWFIGVLGIAMSALASANLYPPSTPVLSVIATICFGVIGFANPERQAAKYQRGFLILDVAICRYEAKLIDIKQLLDSLERAESVMHGNSESSSGSVAAVISQHP